jgi:hypothetical protein
MVNPGFVPEHDPYRQQQGNGMAVAGLVLGVVAIALFWIPVLNWILALLGIVFGAVGMGKAKKIGGRGKGMALGGLICGVVGALLGVLFVVWVVLAVKHTRDVVVAKMHDLDQTEMAQEVTMKYAFEAYPQWSAAHPDQACPDHLEALDVYMDGKGGRDPWGNAYKMFCGPNLPAGATGFAVMSLGPDGVDGTADDIKSW